MKLFAALKQIRNFGRGQLPFLKSIVDFDIIIEVGYAEENEKPLTLKRVLLLNLSSRTTVRRRLARLINKGVIRRRKNAHDRRSSHLMVAPSWLNTFGKYGILLAATSALISS
jgi:hypothetical protein